RSTRDWSSDVCSSDLGEIAVILPDVLNRERGHRWGLQSRVARALACVRGSVNRGCSRRSGWLVHHAPAKARVTQARADASPMVRSEEHTSELQSRVDL